MRDNAKKIWHKTIINVFYLNEKLSKTLKIFYWFFNTFKYLVIFKVIFKLSLSKKTELIKLNKNLLIYSN